MTLLAASRKVAICVLAAVTSGHRLWEIANQLQERYGYAITYEDRMRSC
jgi:hypothetical protein